MQEIKFQIAENRVADIFFVVHYILRKNMMLFKHDYEHFETKCFSEIKNMHLKWKNIRNR
jgi:hypothetical protein